MVLSSSEKRCSIWPEGSTIWKQGRVLPHLQGGRTVQEAASCPVQACRLQHEAFRAISGNSCPSKTGAALLALGSAVLAQAMQVFELLEAMALSH